MNFNHITPAHPARSRRRLFLPIGLGFLLLLLLPFKAGADGTTTVLSFTNAAPITIVDFLSDATPFPSPIPVPALPGVLQSVTVTLYGLSDLSSGGIEILLAGPSGQAVDLMNLAGSGLVTNADISFADNAASFSGGTITSGTFRPSGTDFPFGSPFYQAATTNQLAGFIGTPLAGTWNLSEYYNDYAGADGSISGGWSVNFTLMPTPPAVTNLAATDVTVTSATLNANVNPGGAATTVYFQYGPTTAYGNFSGTNTLTLDVADTQQVALPVTGLLPGTTCHFQALAQNSAGTNASGDLTFVTPAEPILLQASLTNGPIRALLLSGIPGPNYTILSTASLSPPITWTPLTNLTLTSPVQFIHPGPLTGPMEFFALLAGAPPTPPKLQISLTTSSTLFLIRPGPPGSNFPILSTASLSPPITWTPLTNLTLINPV